MKLRLMAALVAVLGVGAAMAQDTTSEKGKLSYAYGYRIGAELAGSKLDVDLATVVRAVQDGYAKKDPAVPMEQMQASLKAMSDKLQAEARAEFEKVAVTNKAASDKFMAANRSKNGVVVLPSGVQYRVIEEGTGKQPVATGEVRLHFRGSLYTGQDFASSYANAQPGQEPEPVTFKVSEFPVDGVRDVLPLMKAGSRWEVFVPAEKAYGNSPRSPIGPNQAVIFDIKLIDVK
jgi:peptidylprolyl isomerase